MIFGGRVFSVFIITITILIFQTVQINAQPFDSDYSNVTQNEPEMMASPEETIPVEIVDKKMSKWEWIVLGTLVVGALAAAGAAAGSGGGGDDGSVSQQPASGTDSGNVEVSW